MASVTYAWIKPLGFDTANPPNPQIEVSYILTDPAQQGDGSGHDARYCGFALSLDPSSPFGWDAAIEAAIIADAAALPQPFTVNAARVLTPVYSDALLKESHDYQVPVTGFAITIGNNKRCLLLDPAATLATGTITMPGNPQNGRCIRIASSKAITALSLLPNTGQSFVAGAALTTIAANGYANYAFHSANNTWFRVG